MKKSFAFFVLMAVLLSLSFAAEPLSAENHLAPVNNTIVRWVDDYDLSSEQNPAADNFIQINFEKAVGGLYATAPRPLWDLIIPVKGSISSEFGLRNGTQHSGTDIATNWGSLIVAVQAGVVVAAGEVGAYGQVVDINHGEGVMSRYAHLSSYPISIGEKVTQGQVIGAVGNTGNSGGPHLHIEIHINGVSKDPYMYIPFD